MRRAVALLLAGALLLGAVSSVAVAAGVAAAGRTLRADLRPAWREQRVLTILAVGSDIGPPDRRGNPLRGRADAIHLIAVDPRRRRATIVDIPRDAYIGGDKVNAHLALGGPRRLRTVLERYTGVAIDYYAVTSFGGLRRMVEQLGGVSVVVDQPMRDRFSRSNFAPGRQRFRGREALQFSRDRKSVVGGDFGRTRHQGQLLRFAHVALRRHHRDLPALTRLAAAFARNTETDIPPRDLLRLAILARSIRPGDVRQDALAGSFGTVGGASVVRLEPGDAFARIRRGRIGP